jgi:hypothetical protein
MPGRNNGDSTVAVKYKNRVGDIAVLKNGRYGVYNGFNGRFHRVVESQGDWPFPIIHFLETNQFSLVTKSKLIDDLEPALF